MGAAGRDSVLWPGGSGFEHAFNVQHQQARAAGMGLSFYVGPELEYFYFKDDVGPELTDEGGYFDVLPADLGNDLRKQTMRTLDRLDIPMEASHHEVAPSQHEIDPHYDEALVMACLLYTSDAADDLLCVDLGGRRIIKKKNKQQKP